MVIFTEEILNGFAVREAGLGVSERVLIYCTIPVSYTEGRYLDAKFYVVFQLNLLLPTYMCFTVWNGINL